MLPMLLAIIFGSFMSVVVLKIMWWLEEKLNKDGKSWL